MTSNSVCSGFRAPQDIVHAVEDDVDRLLHLHCKAYEQFSVAHVTLKMPGGDVLQWSTVVKGGMVDMSGPDMLE